VPELVKVESEGDILSRVRKNPELGEKEGKGVIFLGHMNYYFCALKVISCALKLIKIPPRERKGEKDVC